MPSVKHSGSGSWSLIARKKLHEMLAAKGMSIDCDDVPALRRAVARVLEVPLPETLEEQDDLMRRFSNGTLAAPLREFEPLPAKPWDTKRFKREFLLVLDRLRRVA